MQKNINISDRVEYQLPEFIREEDTQFVNFLLEYYKSQEKTGKPYDILNNLLEYLDLDNYTPSELSNDTILLKDIGIYDTLIEIESVDGFQPNNGSIMINNEIIYYESITRGPDAIITPGISTFQFDKKKQQLENPFPLFTGSRNVFPLLFLGTPVAPPSAEHLIVIVYNELLTAGVDYFIQGDDIRFAVAPRARTGVDTSEFTQLIYLIGFADKNILTFDNIPQTQIQGKKEYPLRINTANYIAASEVGLIVQKNGVLQRPYIDFTLFENQIIFKYPLGGTEEINIRSIEYIAPTIGSGATAIVAVNADGTIGNIISKNGGSKYKLEFAPKVTIQSKSGGRGATAQTLINGIKDATLIDGGQGYTSYNPPIAIVIAPSNPNGNIAELSLTVNDETGQISSIDIENSGSGYDFIPAISFANPSGAKITNPTIDTEGRLTQGSINVTSGGNYYTNAPTVYIDPAPGGGIDAAAIARVSPDRQVYEILITNRGRGYTAAPRARIVDPIGAQVLDVTVSSGAVTNIIMLSGGRGYTDSPSVYIIDDRKDDYGIPIGGTGAEAIATIFNGEITDINIVNFGTGYSAELPPKIFIAAPKQAKASVKVGFGEVTGFNIIETGLDYTPSAFLECSRGVSGVVGYDSLHNEVYAGEAALRQSDHNLGSAVINLDSLFIKEVFEKFRRQYLPTIQIDYSAVNPVQIVKTIKDFYISKGTKLATQYLFKIMFGEEVDIYYPKDEIISPSAATWVVDTILRAELISGDARNLNESSLTQYPDLVDTSVKSASALIENVITIIEGYDTIYELAISEETLQGNFLIPYKTTLVEPLTSSSQIITVDSTIGWPERNGTLIINGEEEVQYKEKSLNQFIECTRSKNGIVEDWDPGTKIYSNIYVYTNKGTAIECKLRVLGIAEAGTTVLSNTGSYYLPGDKLKVANLGSTAEEKKLESWLYNVKKLVKIESIVPGGVNNQTATVTCTNPHGLLVEDSVTIYGANPVVYNGTFTVTSRINSTSFSYRLATPTEVLPVGNILLSIDLNRGKSNVETIDKVINAFTTNIQNAFFNEEYVYIAASGLPNYKVGPFMESALVPGNQRKLLRLPRKVQTVSERVTINPGFSIGAWVNGVSIWTYKSPSYVTYGPLTDISVTNGGNGYDTGSKPNVEIVGGGGVGASATVNINGKLVGFDMTDPGSGYTSQPLVSIVGGGGEGATAQAVVIGQRVTRILVETAGSGYTTQPTVSITGGGGSGATAIANVRGPITSVNLTSVGSGYTSLPTIKLNSGEGALAQPIVINGRIVSIATINSGGRYTTSPEVIINGDGFGAIAKSVIGTTGEDKGKVISITITNKGIGYTQGNTTIRLQSVGEMATFAAEVFVWNKNFENDLSNKYDFARGYVFTGRNNQFGGEYSHLSDPKQLRYVVGDNVFLDPVTNTFKELSSNFRHSPIIGWAFDGNPIYGPYGYADPTDQNSGVRRLRTSYKLKTNIVYNIESNPNPARIDGPSLITYPAGSFIGDYIYNFQSGDLDAYNGRFCKTPDYPEGVYAYFVTIDASESGIPEFPYIIGPAYNSLPDSWNFSSISTQENIPQDVVRYRDPYLDVDIDIERQPNESTSIITTELEGYPIIFEMQDSNNDGLIDASEQQETLQLIEESTLPIFDYFPQVSIESRVDIEVESTTQFEDAKIDGFVIENAGESYQVNDTIFFDNTDTGGFGASALVDSVKGQKIISYTKELIGDKPYGVITSEIEHELKQQDVIIVNSTPILDNTNKTYKVKVVSGIESVSVVQPGLGYNSNIPPTFELLTSQGNDAALEIILENTGVINTVNIINSGNNYSSIDPPKIRVSHPQQYKKTRYWLSEYLHSENTVNVNDIKVTTSRFTYICGSIVEADGDMSGFVAKFDDLGSKIWHRSLLPQNSGLKRVEFIKMYIDENDASGDLIYVAGNSYGLTDNYNPDIFLGLYKSGFGVTNAPDGILQWQKSIGGISGTTRRDYVTCITLDQEKKIYLGGYTDTNSPDPFDMWIIQCDTVGELKEKRKIATEDDSEILTDLRMISDNNFLFVGVNNQNDDCVFGQFKFDGANLEVVWTRQINVTGGKVNNPVFTIDEYGAGILIWNVVNPLSAKFEKVQISKFLVNTVQSGWEWSKQITLSTPFVSLKHAGISVDIFGNYNIVTDVVASENVKHGIIHYLKYDGTILAETKVGDGDKIGYTVVSHAVDNSGDVIIAANRQKSNEVASYRFDEISLIVDSTKQELGTWSYNSTNVTRSTSLTKFGAGAMEVASNSPITISGYNLTTQEWGIRGWLSLNTTVYTAQNTKPTLFEITPSTGSRIKCVIDGTSGSPDFGKALLYINDILISTSTTTTNWLSFAAASWAHVTFQKRNISLGIFKYELFINGGLSVEYQSTTDVNLNTVTVFGPVTSPTTTNTFRGTIDDLIITKTAPYTAGYTVPTSYIPITTKSIDVALIKFDRLHTNRGNLTLTPGIGTTLSQPQLLNYSTLQFTNIEAETTWTDIIIPAFSPWVVGPGGLQILDMSQITSTYTTSNYIITSDKYQYAAKTSTIPSPRGKKLLVSCIVVSKYYLRDATYSKIDTVQQITLNQPAKLSKYSLLQQFNSAGVVQAYGTIVEVPAGVGVNIGVGTTYKVGKIFGTFNNTDRVKTSVNDVNQIFGQYFDSDEPESPWAAGKTYAIGDKVYANKKIYAAQSAGVSGTITPSQTSGVSSDGNLNWIFINAAGNFIINLQEKPYPRPIYAGLDMEEWDSHKLYVIGQKVWWNLNEYQVAVGGAGVSQTTPPTHVTGNVSDGGVTWTWIRALPALAPFARFLPYDPDYYSVQIIEIHPGSTFIPGDVISIRAQNVILDSTQKIATITGFASVKKIRVTARLQKDIIPTAYSNTDLIYCTSTSPHNFQPGNILFVEGFSGTQFNGSFFIEDVVASREFTYTIRTNATQQPTFTGGVGNVDIYTKHPTLRFTKNHQYNFDLSDPSNLGYYLSFSQDNQFKLEYSFNNIVRSGTPGVTAAGVGPFVKFLVVGNIANISYYFDPSRIGANSPVGPNSFIDVYTTPYQGVFKISQIASNFQFKFPLEREPEKTSAEVAEDDQDNPYSFYSTTSRRAVGPINTIKLVSAGGFYKKLPIISEIASFRQIEKIVITSGGTEYAPGLYYDVAIQGDGEGGKCIITVDFDEIVGSGTVVDITLVDPGKGYTFATLDIDAVPGILGQQLAASGATATVVIPAEGKGASVFLTANNIGKIKRLKNNEFGFGYSHDYTLKPEITFPVNLQLFNTSILSRITITNPGSGYTSPPAVVITGGGGERAEAVAIIKNNRLNEIQIKNPGSGYSSKPTVTLKSEFNYVVNLDLNYLQFNFPHGITTGAPIQLRADDAGSTVGQLPRPSSAGLTTLVSGQIYYAIAGDINSLENDQIRFALTAQAAASGDYITFLTQGEGRQVILTEVFGGQAISIVETSRFLEGETVFQGDSLELASAIGKVSSNTGWQIGPKILKIVDYTGDWVRGGRVNGVISKASGIIDNYNIARGVLNIGALTKTPGKFIDDVGKPSEIVQKIQDSFFYQNFSYVIKSDIPITKWKNPILSNNHAAGFLMFGQLQLTGGKDISGRRVDTVFTKEVNINNYANINQISSFAAAQPIYTDYNNTEVLFRKKRLTSSEEILTSIVKKIDDISTQFDGIKKIFPIQVQGESTTAVTNQLLITLNGVIQSPGDSYTVVAGSIVFTEPPKAASRIKYRQMDVTPVNIYRIELYSAISGVTNFGIFPTLGQQVTGANSAASATIIDSGTTHIDVINFTNGSTFQLNEEIVRGTLFSALVQSVTLLNTPTIFRFGETITNLDRDTAVIEEININTQGVISDRIVVSRTSGTAEFETGIFNLKLNEYIYSASSKIAGKITYIAPYLQPGSTQQVDELVLNVGSSFYGLLFERLVSLENPNVVVDDISKSSITPVDLYGGENRINSKFLNFEDVISTEIEYSQLTGGTLSKDKYILNNKVTFINPIPAYHGTAASRFYDASNRIKDNRQQIIDFAEAEIAVEYPDFYFPGDIITNTWSRNADAYRMIQKNRTLIAEMAFDDMRTQYPTFTVPGATGNLKCKRDIGLFIDAISIDVYRGGNVYTRKFINQYFNNLGNIVYVDGEVAQTRFAYTKGLEWAIKAITNTLATTVSTVNAPVTAFTSYKDLTITADPSPNDPYGTAGSNTNNAQLTNCSDIQDALTTLWEIVDTLLEAQSLDELPEQSFGTYSPNEIKCRRDIGLLVDAVAEDVASGGNYNITQFTKKYFTAAGAPIANGLIGEEGPSIVSFNKARDLMYLAINNLLYGKDLTIIYDPASYSTPGSAPGHNYDLLYSTGSNQLSTNCADVQSYIATIIDIPTDAIAAGNLTNVNALTSISDGTYVAGETVRSTKVAYKNKSTGLFSEGDIIKGVASGAVFAALGVNSGLKWIYSSGITGALVDGEYLTNSRLTVGAGATQTVLNKKVGTKAIKFDGTTAAYLRSHDSYDFEFGTGNFTVEGWYFFPSATTGTQKVLFDIAYLSNYGISVVWDTKIRAYTSGGGQSSPLYTTANKVTPIANTWHHISIIRYNGVTTLYVDGVNTGQAADVTNYTYGHITVGANAFSGTSNFNGTIDNFVVYKGYARYLGAFTPSVTYDASLSSIVWGINGESPFIHSITEVYATLTGLKIYTATTKVVDYTENTFVIKDVDLGRNQHKVCADLISLNDTWIAEEAIGRMSAKFPDFIILGDDPSTNNYGGTGKCLRDTKDYIISALVKDLRDGGNYHTLYTARTYLEASGKLKHVGGEILQTLYAWDEVFRIMVEVIATTSTDLSGEYSDRLRIPNNFTSAPSQSIQDEITQLGKDMLQVLAPTTNSFKDSAINIWKNRDYIAEEVVGYLQAKYTKTINNVVRDFLTMPGAGESSCKRDIKNFIIPAIIGDLVTGGTYQTKVVIESYLDTQNNINYVEDELNPMLDAFQKTKELCKYATNNLLLKFGTSPTSIGAPVWSHDEYYVAEYTTRNVYRDDTITVDFEGYPQQSRAGSDRFLDAADIIDRNKKIIAQESVAIMNDLSKYGNLAIPGGQVNCEDDVVDILEALVHDLRFDCNDKIYHASSLYVETENNSLKHIEDDWEASVTTLKIARDLATLTMRNGFGRDYILTNEFSNVSLATYEKNPRDNLYYYAGESIDKNIRFIAENAVADGLAQYPVSGINGNDCVHDVTDVLRALVFNLKYGGDNWMQYVSEFYVTATGGNLDHITSQAAESNWIFNRAKDLAIRAIKDAPITNTSGYTGTQRLSDAVPSPTNRLRNSSTQDGISITSFNNVVTRTFAAGKIDIQNADNTSIGMDNSDDFTARCITVLPSGTPINCVLFEGGGGGFGTWLGFRDGGTYLRLRAGNGGIAYPGGATYTSDTGVAILDIPVSSLSAYMDGNQHTVTWEVRIGGNNAAGPGRVRLWIDGTPIGAATTPGSLNTGLAAGSGAWSGGDNGGFAATAGGVPNGEPTTAWPYAITGTMSYYRARLVDSGYTGTEGNIIYTEINTLMSKVTSAISNPSTVAARSYTLPNVWPVKYTPEIVLRDLNISFDAAGENIGWNGTCAQVASAIDTLMDIPIDTITKAATLNQNNLTSITRTYRPQNNTEYQLGTCIDVLSTLETLFDIVINTLGAGSNNTKIIANMLLFNQLAIATRAFNETKLLYPTSTITIDFANVIINAIRYDLITSGNSGVFALAQQWFDGEGNFIAFTNVNRTHLIYCVSKIREHMKSVLYQLDLNYPSWNLYTTAYNPAERLEYFQEDVEFAIDSSMNPIDYALRYSRFPTEASITFIASTDVVNLVNRYEMGIDYNTNPELVTLLPLTEVGFERAEYRVRINRPNRFRRGDVIQYIPGGGVSLAGTEGSDYWYVINAEANWLEIGADYIHDGRFRNLNWDITNTSTQILQVVRRDGVTVAPEIYPIDPSDTPILGGFQNGDVIYGVTSEAIAAVGDIQRNRGRIFETYTRYELENVDESLGIYDNFINGEKVVVQGTTTNFGYVLQTTDTNDDAETFINLINESGVINVGDDVEGVDSGATATVAAISDRLLLTVKQGSFDSNQWIFGQDDNALAYIDEYINKQGTLISNSGGRITMDVETITGSWNVGDVIYGNLTDYILTVKGISGTQLQLNQYIHGKVVYELTLGQITQDTGVADEFNIGDEVFLFQGTTKKNPGFSAIVTKFETDVVTGISKLWIANPQPIGAGAPITELTDGANNIGKISIGSNFPSIYASVPSLSTTDYSSYGKVVFIEQSGITATIWIQDAIGEFVDNMTVISDYDWAGAVVSAETLEGRVERYFRGFDGIQTTFDLTITNGDQYFPDPAGHLLIFINAVLQPPGATNAYVVFSDKVQFSEAPEVGSEFIAYYVGKLRQLDDISFEFDSLRSSFNLKRDGLFYSLTLTEGASSSTILPENNIIISMNGIIQEPGVSYELVGSRVIFSEVPRSGASFVGFSYIGSDADVIAATVIPPIEPGDQLDIEGEQFNRDVAVIESSNSLVTFEYTGSVKGRNAQALSSITSGQLTNAILTNPGNGYTSRPNVDVISSSGFDGNVKALMGISRIDVANPGGGYLAPVVAIDNTVPDDFISPVGFPVNNGRDIFNPLEDDDDDPTNNITPGAISIIADPSNVTVNQGQTANFTVIATVSNTATLNYQWQKKEYGTNLWFNLTGANQRTYVTQLTTQAYDQDEYRAAITAAGAIPVYTTSAVLSVQTGATVIANFTPDQIFDDI